MKIIFLTLILLLCFLTTVLFAQTPTQTQAISIENDLKKVLAGGAYNMAGNNMIRSFGTQSRGFEGTPCVFGEWYATDIYLKDGFKYEKVPAKLDVYKEQELVVLRKKEGDSILVNDALVAHFEINNTTTGRIHIFKRYQVGINSADKFCEVVHEGKYSIVAYHMKTLLASDFQGAQSTGRYYDKFLSAIEFYIITPDKDVIKIKKSKKSLLQALKHNKIEFEAYLDKNKIDFDKKETLASALAFYNSLLK
jgi:hypothetical protein